MTPPRRKLLRQWVVSQCWSGYCPVHARPDFESVRAGVYRLGGGTRPRGTCRGRLERLAVVERVERPAADSANPTPKHKNQTFLEISHFQRAENGERPL